MKLLFCLMGDICNGKYEMYQYLIDAYKLQPFKTYTTRKIRKNFVADNFIHVELLDMLMMEKNNEVIAVNEVKGHHYGKRLADLNEGFSVCAIDYKGYLEVSKHVATVGILIKKTRLARFNLRDCDIKHPKDFLDFEEIKKEEYLKAQINKDLVILKPENMVDLKILIDDVIQEYIEDIALDVDKDFIV